MERGFYLLMALAIGYAAWVHWLRPSPHLDQWTTGAGTQVSAQGVQVKELEAYSGEFRILSREDYSSGTEAQFSPVDFAVSEGVLASRTYYPLIGVRQDNRYLTWTMKALPLPPQQAMQLVSNIHIIPANPKIAAQLAQVHAGDLVQLQGDLVQINDHGWIWRSSLSRVDVGDGACEILRVQAIKWVEKSVG